MSYVFILDNSNPHILYHGELFYRLPACRQAGLLPILVIILLFFHP
jgi:hypothetical protein